MTKRDFILIARVLRAAKGDASRATEAATVARIAAGFAEELAQCNPKFDSARFLAACGVEG